MISRPGDKKARRFPRLKAGDELTPRHLNVIYAFLEELCRERPGGKFATHGHVLVATSPITAAVGNTLGKGTAKLWRLYPDGDNVKRADTGVEVTIYNLAEGADGEIAEGKVVQVKRVDGYLLADVDLCEPEA